MPDMSHPINNVVTGSLSALHDLTFEGWWPEDQDEKMMRRKGLYIYKTYIFITYICYMCGVLWLCVEARSWIPWGWSYKQFWVTCCEYWGPTRNMLISSASKRASFKKISDTRVTSTWDEIKWLQWLWLTLLWRGENKTILLLLLFSLSNLPSF